MVKVDDGVGDGGGLSEPNRLALDASDLEQAEAWFEKRTFQERSLMTSRAALRVMANTCLIDPESFTELALPVFWAALISTVRGSGRSVYTVDRASSIPAPLSTPYSANLSAAHSAESAAAHSAAHSAESAAHAVQFSALSIADCATAADDVHAARPAFQAAETALRKDAQDLLLGKELLRVWNGVSVPEAIQENHRKFVKVLSADQNWRFFHHWYLGMWDGTWTDWNLAHEVAQIEASVWEAGLNAVAAEIEAIEAKREVVTRLEEILSNTPAALADRHGIGGNAPPEPIDDIEELKHHTTVIWAGVETLEAETNAKKPNAERVNVAIALLGKGLRGILAWLGRKADIAINTLIVSGVTSYCAYLVANPTKLEGLIQAAKHWISLFP